MGLTNKSKPSVDRRETDEQKAALEGSEFGSGIGLNNDPSFENLVVFDQARREKVLSNDDSYIVLGGDRIASKASGYGGKGHTGAHMIDLVVGRNDSLKGNPVFAHDAARVYISQKTDVDRSFGLVEGTVKNPKARSSVAIKADGVRIVAREGIKLVTMGKGTLNSHGNKLQTYTGIDLIAGNDDSEMEPIALADTTAEAMMAIIELIENLSNMCESFWTEQVKYNIQIASHVHVAPFGPTSPAPNLVQTGIQATIKDVAKSVAPMYLHRVNCTQTKVNYCKPYAQKFIGSRYNYSN
tara:strand:- start:12 stop:902 length:891 start_codon:yes stop_codon:yes gene_type:complete